MPRRKWQPETVDNLLVELHIMKKYKKYKNIEKIIRDKFQALIEQPELWLEFIYLDSKYKLLLWQGFWFYKQPDILKFLKKL